ncbi:MAG: hypothetical protein OZSIB_1446 [Candidatus Ozemobacter sibiricus]|jgi:hypothetical protein|uniref:Uncharacterized protein n=1 Tax=Candidatus Ozemobacter sibiricus TaxID=2268124 RepID=A0A367ZK97_9BACT|nr:MAG: hypothetical protein OZSIB_1446 [Candidatus Ozemobacter sibiricus]
MKIRKLRGVIDRMVSGVAAIVPDDRTPEVYVAASDIPGAREGLAVDLVIVPQDDPNAVCPVVGRKPPRPPRPQKIKSFTSLVRQMIKTRDRLKATLAELEQQPGQDGQELQEKIDFLEKGIDLFSR